MSGLIPWRKAAVHNYARHPRGHRLVSPWTARQLALHEMAFTALSASAGHGDAATELIGKTLGFWSRAAA
ncbi:hypothetical protein [Streptomyces chartreusis]|uniref:hypothetical protein n=1 Tax=Streptomyces chartreusis TaxID=1969 RepID=UPI00382B3D5E